MRKLLLISDDYSENNRLQTLLKKIGFDASAITSITKLQVDLLNLNPDLVVARRVQKQSGTQVLGKIRENAFFKGKTILVIAPEEETPTAGELAKARPDAVLEAPFEVEKLIEALSHLTGTAAAPFLEKLKRAKMDQSHLPQNLHIKSRKGLAVEAVTVEGAEASLEQYSDPARMSKYEAYLKDVHVDTTKTSHGRAEIKKAQAELVKNWDKKMLQGLDDLRKEFVKALFSKAPKSDKMK